MPKRLGPIENLIICWGGYGIIFEILGSILEERPGTGNPTEVLRLRWDFSRLSVVVLPSGFGRIERSPPISLDAIDQNLFSRDLGAVFQSLSYFSAARIDA